MDRRLRTRKKRGLKPPTGVTLSDQVYEETEAGTEGQNRKHRPSEAEREATCSKDGDTFEMESVSTGSDENPEMKLKPDWRQYNQRRAVEDLSKPFGPSGPMSPPGMDKTHEPWWQYQSDDRKRTSYCPYDVNDKISVASSQASGQSSEDQDRPCPVHSVVGKRDRFSTRVKGRNGDEHSTLRSLVKSMDNSAASLDIIPATPTTNRHDQAEDNEMGTVSGRDVDPEQYGWSKEHCVFSVGDDEPMTAVHHLGHGSLGVVEEVRRTNTNLPTLVRKRVKIPITKRHAAQISNIIHEEVAILRKLNHQNIVTLLGTYEDQRNVRHASYCLLMLPVGDNDLESFLAIAGEENDLEMRTHNTLWIQSWYRCLASALAYMHENGVRHQDIKPSNIVHKGSHVFFTDFSSAGKFQLGRTTSTANPTRSTAMYAAPEVLASSYDALIRHGCASDVFGLGCVFCDMLTVEIGGTVVAFHENITVGDDETHRIRYSERLYEIHRWFSETSPRLFWHCIRHMLFDDRKDRATAAEALEYVDNMAVWLIHSRYLRLRESAERERS